MFSRVGEYDTRITEGNEDTIKVLKIESHPKYSRQTIDYDIAIMKLSRNAKLGAYVGTACLPNANEEPNNGTECYITGMIPLLYSCVVRTNRKMIFTIINHDTVYKTLSTISLH